MYLPETESLKGLSADGQIIIVSDGGQKGDHGIYGWIIGTQHGDIMERTSQGERPTDDISQAVAYNCKLAWICFLKNDIVFLDIQVKCGVTSFSICVICQTIRANGKRGSATVYDILQEIRIQQDKIHQLIPRQQKGTHVRGHQDKHKQLTE